MRLTTSTILMISQTGMKKKIMLEKGLLTWTFNAPYKTSQFFFPWKQWSINMKSFLERSLCRTVVISIVFNRTQVKNCPGNYFSNITSRPLFAFNYSIASLFQLDFFFSLTPSTDSTACFHATPLLMIYSVDKSIVREFFHTLSIHRKHIIKINFLSWCCFASRARTHQYVFYQCEHKWSCFLPIFFFHSRSFLNGISMTFWFPYQKEIYSLNTFVGILVFDSFFFPRTDVKSQ